MAGLFPFAFENMSAILTSHGPPIEFVTRSTCPIHVILFEENHFEVKF
jgi:hypothetical protein